MAANSKIEWTDHTFNPWWGCTKVAAGCSTASRTTRSPASSLDPLSRASSLSKSMCWCGAECVGEVCRSCLLNVSPLVDCVYCGASIVTGYVSIKGRCYDCQEKREAFADFVFVPLTN